MVDVEDDAEVEDEAVSLLNVAVAPPPSTSEEPEERDGGADRDGRN
jgi:hypothetical protein